MILVAERINTSVKGVEPVVRSRDHSYVTELARLQAEAGADYLDVNAGTLLEEEESALCWLVDTLQKAVDLPLCIDTPNPGVLAAALERHKGKALVNSITAEEERFAAVLPLVQEHGAGVIALCMDDAGIPKTTDKRLAIARRLIGDLTDSGVATGDIYVDPLVQPLGTDHTQVRTVLDTLSELRNEYPRVHTICGLSNVSYGLPRRKRLNSTFLVMAMTAGLDAAILDVLDPELMARLRTAAALGADDPFCAEYLKAYRAGRL